MSRSSLACSPRSRTASRRLPTVTRFPRLMTTRTTNQNAITFITRSNITVMMTFFVEHIADDATRRRLDQAWTDLLTSFEYHDANLRFVAKKFSLDLGGRSIAELDRVVIDRLAGRATRFRASLERRIRVDAASASRRRTGSRGRRLARSPSEPGVGRCPRTSRNDCGRSMPTCAARVLWIIRGPSARCWPAFWLPRHSFIASNRRPNDKASCRLSDRQLASRLSYFVWSSRA